VVAAEFSSASCEISVIAIVYECRSCGEPGDTGTTTVAGVGGAAMMAQLTTAKRTSKAEVVPDQDPLKTRAGASRSYRPAVHARARESADRRRPEMARAAVFPCRGALVLSVCSFSSFRFLRQPRSEGRARPVVGWAGRHSADLGRPGLFSASAPAGNTARYSSAIAALASLALVDITFVWHNSPGPCRDEALPAGVGVTVIGFP